MPAFITVSNIESSAMDVVRAGNERVIRPRLSDAMFFWEQDRRHTLACAFPDCSRSGDFPASGGDLAAEVGTVCGAGRQSGAGARRQ